jgi:geranylgeranyl reductase family protein
MDEAAEVVVVGAGPAGCAAALHLANLGHEVVLVERQRFPREKVCGEGLMPHGVAELRGLGLAEAMLATGARAFHGIAYHLGEQVAVGRFPGADAGRGGYGFRRLRFDAALLAACSRHAGVRVRVGARVVQVRTEAASVQVRCDDGTIRARAVIGADGAQSVVRRQLGLGRRANRPPRYGARGHFRLAEGRSERDVVDVVLLQGREFYLTSVGAGEVNVTLLCGKATTVGFGGDLPGGFAREIAQCPEVADYLDGAEPISDVRLCGPLRQRVTGLVADRALLVGDAAGFVDAITGEGMSLAMASARLAAGVLSRALRIDRLDRASLRPYEVARRRFARDLIWLTEIMLWWVRHPRLARRVLGQLARHPDTFGRLLAVNVGESRLSGVRPGDVRRLLFG